MAHSVKSLLGGRYKLSGERGRSDLECGWDRWLDRPVFIEIFPLGKTDSPIAKRAFIDTAAALVRIDHPNIEALLDYGSTEAGTAYHVLRDGGEELRASGWASARTILLDVIAGVEALHHAGIGHGDLGLHSVARIDGRVRIVEFGECAPLRAGERSSATVADDVHGIAALGFRLLTGRAPTGRAPASNAAALAQTDAPAPVRATLLRILAAPQALTLAQLRRVLEGEPTRAWLRPRMLSAAAGVAASAMLAIGLSSSAASWQLSRSTSERGSVQARADEQVCEHELASPPASPDSASADPLAGGELFAAAAPQLLDRLVAAPLDLARVEFAANFDAARSRVQVGSEAHREAVVVRSTRFDLHRDLPPAALVERGIDLTHGRPTPEDDPRLPIVDGPARARALFEAACARSYGKGCHMLGVQIAEGMTPDDGAGPAEHYRNGCALDYHRSCAALADLARAGEIPDDVGMLDAKACLLAGPGSSYCLPKPAP